MPGFLFGKKSKAELVGVHPDLVKVSNLAIQLTLQDFGIYDGNRSKAEQAECVRTGVSQTMESKHRGDIQPGGQARAVDAVPWINGKFRWEWEPIYKIAKAFQTAARELGVKIRWGGCWDRLLNDIGDPRRESNAYGERRRKAKKRVFLDGPHFELG